MVLAAIGVAIGVGGALWLTHFLATFLFGVKALDPMAFIATLLLLSAVARRLDSARRATRVSPVAALRFE